MVTAMASNSWHTLDHLVDLECASRTYGQPMPSLINDIHSQRNIIIDSTKSIEDFNSLGDSELPGPDYTQQKVAWIMQRVIGARCYCVGSKIVRHRAGSCSSPVLDQLTEFDASVDSDDIEVLANRWSKSKRRNAGNNRLDAMAVDPASRTLYLVKCANTSQISYSGRTPANLFLPDDQIITNVRVSPEPVNALLCASQMISAATKNWTVKLLFVVVGDEYSWSFQCHDVTRIIHQPLLDRPVYLDDYPLFATTRSFSSELFENPDLFSMVGEPPKFTSLKEALNVCPVYRYTRAMMLLLELWEEQCSDPSRLVAVPASVLQDRVSNKYGFPYTIDARRHDLEDCLRAGQFVGRVPWKRNEYAIELRGVERVLVMKHKYNKMAPVETQVMVDRAFEQKKLWRRNSGGYSL